MPSSFTISMENSRLQNLLHLKLQKMKQQQRVSNFKYCASKTKNPSINQSPSDTFRIYLVMQYNLHNSHLSSLSYAFWQIQSEWQNFSDYLCCLELNSNRIKYLKWCLLYKCWVILAGSHCISYFKFTWFKEKSKMAKMYLDHDLHWQQFKGNSPNKQFFDGFILKIDSS